jgi:hypothetical protein
MAVIRGRLLDERGDPIPDGAVYFVEGPVPLPDIAAQASTAGAFSLSAPAPGWYRLGARAEGFAAEEIEVQVASDADEEVELVLRRSTPP